MTPFGRASQARNDFLWVKRVKQRSCFTLCSLDGHCELAKQSVEILENVFRKAKAK
jgi:hypothetical protein